MAVIELFAYFTAGFSCAAAALFLLSLLFIEVTDAGWHVKTPW